MAKDPLIWTRIMTHNRSMFHIVEGIGLFFTIAITGDVIPIQNILVNPYFIYSLSWCAVGIFLLHAIIKENRKEIVVYLVVNTFMLWAKHGFLLYTLIRFLLFNNNYLYQSYVTIILYLSCLGIYCGYEWLMFYFVVKFCQIVQKDVQEYIQDRSPSPERKDEVVP